MDSVSLKKIKENQRIGREKSKRMEIKGLKGKEWRMESVQVYTNDNSNDKSGIKVNINIVLFVKFYHKITTRFT